MSQTLFRNQGAIGAILDEYEKSILELIELIHGMQSPRLLQIVDSETTDRDCQSIQSILTHVIHSGYVYIIEIRNHLGEEISYPQKEYYTDVNDYVMELKAMFTSNEKLFQDYPNIELNQVIPDKKILVRWGQRYDVEQLFEHAIVHVLRHRRQIQRFIPLSL